MNEIELAKKIIKVARSRETSSKIKNKDDLNAIIELGYFVTIRKANKDTIESRRIENKLKDGYYKDIFTEAKKEPKVEYKLAKDNMQYCFF